MKLCIDFLRNMRNIKSRAYAHFAYNKGATAKKTDKRGLQMGVIKARNIKNKKSGDDIGNIQQTEKEPKRCYRKMRLLIANHCLELDHKTYNHRFPRKKNKK